MGTITSVRCASCGYQEPALSGVGGSVGFAAQLMVTAVCTKNARLVDTDAGGLGPGDLDRYLDEDVPPKPGRCPKRNCRSRTHAAWDPKTAVCPACGEPGCAVTKVGNWD